MSATAIVQVQKILLAFPPGQRKKQENIAGNLS